MQYVILLVLIALVIGFFVMIWKASPHWRWYSLVTASITLLLTVAMLFPTAIILKSRSAWHRVKEDQEVRLAAALAERETLNFGNPNDPTAGKGAIQLNQELAKLGAEAGRRWRNLRVADMQGKTIRLVQPPPPADEFGEQPDPPPAEDQGQLVPESLVVYAFAEQPRPGFEFPVPNFYLGEFRVTASDADSVTIEPTSALTPAQEQVIGNRQAVGWALYELLPLDGHEPFMAEGSRPDDENLFGRPNDELITQLLGGRVSEEVLQDYRRDGSRALPDDPKPNRWVKVEFTKPYTENVDSLSQSGALEGGFFDGSGRALDSRLQRGDDGVTFDVGDQLVVTERAAEALFDDGVARLVDTYFVRTLNDYRFVLRNSRQRLAEREMRKKELEFENNVLQQAVTSSQNLLVKAQGEQLQLEQDKAQTVVEREAIAQYVEELEQRVKQTRETLVRLYRSNQQLEDELQRSYGTN